MHTLTRRLGFARPLCPDNLYGHLVATAVPGVEEWRHGAYRRTLRLPGGPAVVALTPGDPVTATLHLTDPDDADAAVARCRRILDLDADPTAVDAALRADPVLAALVDAAPGRRVPGSPDPEEFAVRAVVGQQGSTAAARTHARRLVTAHGASLVDLGVADPEGALTHLFPTPHALTALTDDELAMPRTRKRTLHGLVAALADGTVDLTGDLATARSGLAALRGIGPWTVDSVAMRALGDPDAFLATDLGIRHVAPVLGLPDRDRDLVARAEAWRPYRAYATQYLWAALDHPVNTMPG